MESSDHIDTRSDHSCGMDESADRGRAGHGIGEPNIERDLSGFTGCGKEEEECNDGDRGILDQGLELLRGV